MTYTATYSPEDNKLRLYSVSRLDAETYARVKAAGFKWAPKQGFFVAPMWTTGREDLLLELAGDIGDEDTTLVDRAEERADRFEGYSERRLQDAESARKAVASISDHIPLGQPILIGHHSEKHARRDAEKIENGMRKAVKMWQTSKYWEDRAAGAIRHAKYKERSDVRERRIKGLEADKRKQERYKADAEKWLKLWSKDGLTLDQARAIANFCRLSVAKQDDGIGYWSAYDVLLPDGERYKACPARTVEQCQEAAKWAYPRQIAHCDRWIEHYSNRLTYERAMLAESGGSAGERFDFKVGGKVLRRGQWFIIAKVNPGSVSVFGHWASTVSFDEIQDYEEPTEEQAAAVAKAVKIPPLCNYPGEGFKHMTRADYDSRKEKRWSDFPKTKTIAATETAGVHRVPCARGTGQWDVAHVYISDAKRKDPPKKDASPLDLKPKREPAAMVQRAAVDAPKEANAFEAMRESLRAGVQIAVAPQLFPTPPELAARMVEMAEIEPGARVLEPSAGTGNLLSAIEENAPSAHIVGVEINHGLAERLRQTDAVNIEIRCADFLACNGELGTFDRIVMNPPFQDASDIKHIEHALHMLNPGGRLVAICANGPRQREQLQPIADEWIDLPAGTFKEAGTGVNTALLVIQR